jgi:hypothetical protein
MLIVWQFFPNASGETLSQKGVGRWSKVGKILPANVICECPPYLTLKKPIRIPYLFESGIHSHE